MQSITRAFQKILNRYTLPDIKPVSVEHEFALRRFRKKFEIPESKAAAARRLKTFEQWRSYDEGLSQVSLPKSEWYLARLMIHKIMKSFRIGELTFTGGSQSEPLHGLQSVADKLLTHAWEVSPNCADLFVRLAVHDRAFVKAAKMRARRSLGDGEYVQKCKQLYRIRSSQIDVRKYWLYWCLTSRDASRYSVVRKNNEIDRSIDLQPFINMVVQRAIGVGLRSLLREELDLDLDTLQDVHRLKVMDSTAATIDLKNASDSNTWSLLRFMYPKWFVRLIEQATPEYIEGLDGHYYLTKKVSSMGNGFTFELMNLTLLAVTRQIDPRGSVYGDDIIVTKDAASRLILVLESAGWVVNKEKSFITGPFRESCGANFYDGVGYFKSFDFEYPTNIGECVVFLNKCYLLREWQPFGELYRLLLRTIPPALRGPSSHDEWSGHPLDDLELSVYAFHNVKHNNEGWFRSRAAELCWPTWHCHMGLHFSSGKRMPRRGTISMKRHGLLYFTYMHSGRVTDVVLTGRGDWSVVAFISDGRRSIRAKALMKE